MKNKNQKTTRVAIYIRIGGKDFASAFEKQKANFAEIISKNASWELIETYADLGTDTRKQPNLARLIADCRAGRIDLIVTKSTSRISRSTNSLMSVVRELAYLKSPVGVYFEDTKLNTLEKDSFLLLTMFEAMAIRESGNKYKNISCISLSQHLKKHKKKKEKNSNG